MTSVQEKKEKVVLRFAVVSDVHVDDTDLSVVEERNFQSLFTHAYAYANQQDYKKLDAILVLGDMTNRGTEKSYQKFLDIVKENLKEETFFRCLLGNHEFFVDPSEVVIPRFLRMFGYESDDLHFVLGGYDFILLSCIGDTKRYSEEKREWLKQALSLAEKRAPNKPIFVFQHFHLENTVYGSHLQATADLTDILQKYPQVIDFSGHSHYPINDPRSIWQGEFTALGTGTLKFFAMGLNGLDVKKVCPADEYGGYAEKKMTPKRDAATYYLVEVGENDLVHIMGFDLFSGERLAEYVLSEFKNPANFIYTDARKTRCATPFWDKDAMVDVIRVGASSAEISVPQAYDEENVESYRFELYDKNGEKKDTVYRLSMTFYRPLPQKIVATFENLEAGEYEVYCYAVNSWEKISLPLKCSFTVGKGSE